VLNASRRSVWETVIESDELCLAGLPLDLIIRKFGGEVGNIALALRRNRGVEDEDG
jgi:hypothetical protein